MHRHNIITALPVYSAMSNIQYNMSYMTLYMYTYMHMVVNMNEFGVAPPLLLLDAINSASGLHATGLSSRYNRESFLTIENSQNLAK